MVSAPHSYDHLHHSLYLPQGPLKSSSIVHQVDAGKRAMESKLLYLSSTTDVRGVDKEAKDAGCET